MKIKSRIWIVMSCCWNCCHIGRFMCGALFWSDKALGITTRQPGTVEPNNRWEFVGGTIVKRIKWREVAISSRMERENKYHTNLIHHFALGHEIVKSGTFCVTKSVARIQRVGIGYVGNWQSMQPDYDGCYQEQNFHCHFRILEKEMKHNLALLLVRFCVLSLVHPHRWT